LTSAIVAADKAGAETLAIMQAAPRYNRWQFQRIAPYLGRRICEVGAGIGNMSALIAESQPEQLVLTDLDPAYREILHTRFAGSPNIVIEHLALPDRSAASRYKPYNLDTVVALNVLEHISEDVEALRSVGGMLQPGGRAVVLVPAFEQLFGTLDRELAHVRRYTRRSLIECMTQGGFHVERVFYFNLIGTLGWWVNARLRKMPRIPIKQLRYFDAIVPILQLENFLPLPLGQSVIAVGVVNG
jgi:SAM-dependent methyltransferase